VAAGNVQIVLSVDQVTYTQAMKEAQRQLDTFAGKAKGAGHATVSSMQASSAAIRLMEGGMQNNVRAVERLISTIPGVGKALQAAFPLVGGLALAGLLARMGGELEKFIKTALQAPDQIKRGFESLHTSALQTNDALRLTNDELANQIAKLEGKPQNNAKIAIDETRLAADKLARSLEEDNSRITELLSKNSVGFFAALLTHQGGTDEVAGSVKSYENKFQDLGFQYNQAMHSGNTGLAASFQKQIEDAQQSALNWAKAQMADRRTGQHTTGDQSANINILEGFSRSISDTQDRQTLENTNATESSRDKQLQAAHQYREEQKKAAAAQLEAWKQQLTELKSNEDVTLSQESDFWLSRAAMVKRGSLSYVNALQESMKLAASVRADNVRESARTPKLMDDLLTSIGQTSDLSKGDTGFLEGQGKSAVDYLKNLQEQVQVGRENAQALAEQALQMAVATGRMSQLDAATVAARMHAADYQDTLDGLQQKLDEINGNAGLTQIERQQQASAVQKDILVVQGQRDLTANQDAAAVSGNTIPGALTNALNAFVQSSRDTAAQISSTFVKTLDSFNDQVVKAFEGHHVRTDFSGVGAELFQTISKTALQHAEGDVMSAFGFGGSKKPTGTSGDPLHVWVQNQGGPGGGIPGLPSLPGFGQGSWTGNGGGFLSGVRSFLGGGSKDTLFGSAQGALNFSAQPADIDTDTSFLDSLPGFAGGGDPTVNRPSIVGEAGPELFVPRTAGTIVPNHALGGSTTHNWNIDARGANDPAATEAAVQRGIAAAAPQIVSASLHAANEQRKRTPSSRR
jgi:hypothetical protein